MATSNNAYDALLALLKRYGLESLAKSVKKLLTEGYSQEQIGFLIQETPEYKKRFAGNEIRKQKGMPALDPNEYIAVEQAYRQILSTAGLPTGFYDSPSDFSGWIGKDVSPKEISTRVDIAISKANEMSDELKNVLQEWYGLTPGDIAAFALNQERSLPLLEKINKGTTLAATLRKSGLDLTQSRAEQLGGMVGDRNAMELGSELAMATHAGERLSAIYGGDDYLQSEAEEEIFYASEEAQRRRLRLSAMEEATFSGSSAVGKGTFSRETNY